MGWVTELLDGEAQAVANHPIHSLIAVSSLKNSRSTINIYNEDLTPMQNINTGKDVLTKILVWHPIHKLLAFTSTNGTLRLCNLDSGSSLTEFNVHVDAITCLNWNSNGHNLVTGDGTGMVVVWKADSKGNMSVMSQFHLKSGIEHITFHHKKNEGSMSSLSNECIPSLFVADRKGGIYYADDAGNCTECLSTSKCINSLDYHLERGCLVVLTEDLILTHYVVTKEGKLIQSTEWIEVKFGGVLDPTKKLIRSQWVDRDTLAYCPNIGSPRLWNSKKDESITLDLDLLKFAAMAFSKINQILAVASESGSVVLWVKNTKWEVSNCLTKPSQQIEMKGMVRSLSWGCDETVLLVETSVGIQIITEQTTKLCGFGGEFLALQTGPRNIALQIGTAGQIIVTNGKIKGFVTSKNVLIAHTGAKLEVFIPNDSIWGLSKSIEYLGNVYALNNSTVFYATGSCLYYQNVSTDISSSISIPVLDGAIISICTAKDRVFLLTSINILKCYEVLPMECKLISSCSLQSQFYRLMSDLTIKSNSSGSFFDPTTINVFSVEQNQMFLYECNSKIMTTCWDVSDPRVLIVQTQSISGDASSQIYFFYATEKEFVLKDCEKSPLDCELLASVSIPFCYYQKRVTFQRKDVDPFIKDTMKEYIGVNASDLSLVKTITDFCYQLSIGQVDEAAKVIKLIKNDTVWENMAKVCIKLRRLKLAKLCLGQLKNAKALRTVKDHANSSDDNQCAMLAMHLGLNDEAKDIWSETKNYASLSSYYQSIGKWDNALEIASTVDRQSLPSTYFKFGTELSSKGERNGAIAAFEKSNASKARIPRMMLNNADDLSSYINSSTDHETKKWWARNAESHGDVETALKFYTEINDIFSIVRVYCRSGEMQKAVSIAGLNPENLAASYYIAREYEKGNDWSNAIAFYARSKYYGSAIRLAKDHNFDKELLQLALKSSPSHMLSTARYLEERGEMDKAAILYAKAKYFKKALDICISIEDVSMLETVAALLDPAKNHLELQIAAEYLAVHGSNETAMKLLLGSGKLLEAVDLCETSGVLITDEFIAFLEISSSCSDAKAVYTRLAQLSYKQASYHISCKCYALGGDRLKAMEALLKSGDNEKIILFANVSKQADIFVLAANYLQSLNWVNDNVLMRTIVVFYTKAKAKEQLSLFYETCAQIEIDEFQDYEKALCAFIEAEKCLNLNSDQIPGVQRRIELVKLFVKAKEASKSSPQQCESICAELFDHPDVNDVVRTGDILGLLIETNYEHGEMEKAKVLFDRLSQLKNVRPDYYVNETICRAFEGGE